MKELFTIQGRHSETRAELDFEVNQKAEREIMATLLHLERNTDLLLQLMQHLDCRVSDEELRAIEAEKQSGTTDECGDLRSDPHADAIVKKLNSRRAGLTTASSVSAVNPGRRKAHRRDAFNAFFHALR